MTKPLDDIDRHLLALLRANARTPLTTLAKRVGLSRSAAQERLARLEKNGTIARYTVQLTRGVHTVRAWIQVRFSEGRRCTDVVPAILERPEVRLCHSLVGPVDLLLHVEVVDTQALLALREHLAGLPGVAKVDTATLLQAHLGD
jgi:DNA-binding Lrp family transcriptional regulator